MRLYDYGPSQNCFKVRLLAAQLNIVLDIVPVAIFKGEAALPSFLEKNPMGGVPVLETDTGEYLPESNAILMPTHDLVGTWEAANWAIRFYQQRGFELVSPVQKNLLLRTYWDIPDRQIETSVVLANPSLNEVTARNSRHDHRFGTASENRPAGR